VQEGSHPDSTLPPADQAATPTIGVFADHEHVRAAIRALEAAGVEPDAISVLARTPAEARELDRETGVSRDLADVTGQHRLHDWLDWLASLGGELPGFGPVAGTGNLGLDVARSKSDAGAVTGALVGLGVSVEDAQRYEAQVHEGKLLVVVHGASDQSAARAALASATPVE
jgi:hypothetical protein